MFVAPTARYRIEGCNDLKKIERALRSESNPHHNHPRHFNIAKTFPLPSQSGTRGDESSTSQPSLMSRVTILQDAQFFASPTTTPTLDKVNEADIAAAEESVSSTTTMSTLASTSTLTMSSAQLSDIGSSLSSSTCSPLIPVPCGPNSGNLSADYSSSAIVSSSNPYLNGQPMARVKSLPESKDEWAALQKRKGNASNVGVGAVSPDVESSMQSRQQQRSESCGSALTPNISMLGEYSQEHMGHEAYYYRSWFLGKGKMPSLHRMTRFNSLHQTDSDNLSKCLL